MNNAVFIEAQTVKAAIARLKLEYPELSDDAELLTDTLEGETDLHEVLTRIIRREREAVAFANAIKEQEEELAERRSRFLRRQNACRSIIMSLLNSAGVPKITLPVATLSIANGRLSCTITDETKLPDEYVETKRIPQKDEIAKALNAGKLVPGAVLKNGAPHLLLRVR